MKLRVVQGDCLKVLRRLESDSVDAVVTDPPYGLSREPDIAEVLSHWLAGDTYQHSGGGFMGKSWDSFVPGPEYWRAVYRVMKPGAYLLCFAGTRTWDLMSIALRFAGFENRDTVRHDFGPPALGWIHGQGFPKSKALLKPAWEPVLVFRKPGPLRHLNIDGCRVGTGGQLRWERPRDMGYGRGTDGGPCMATEATAGRWPANFVLSHSPGCEQVGTKRVKGDGAFPAHSSANTVYGPLGGHGTGERREIGAEEVAAWRCAPGCPVALLDEQSGMRKSGALLPGHKRGDGPNVPYGGGGLIKKAYGGDDGTASRFFHCLEADPFAYFPKASRRERNAGCEGLPEKRAGVGDERPSGGMHERAGDGGAVLRANHHPTVKPLALMRHLIRLIAAPGDLVLDPFAGSGSTGVAALQEGCRFLGVEREAEYAEIARARLAAANPAPVEMIS